MWELLEIFALIFVILLVFYYKNKNASNFNEVFEKIALQKGLDYKQEGKRGEITGKINGLGLRVYLEGPSFALTSEVIKLTIPKQDYIMSISSAGRLDPTFTHKYETVKTGHEKFDKIAKVKTSHPKITKKLLDSEMIEKILYVDVEFLIVEEKEIRLEYFLTSRKRKTVLSESLKEHEKRINNSITLLLDFYNKLKTLS